MGRLCMLLLLVGVCLTHSKDTALFKRTRRGHIAQRNTPIVRRSVGRKNVKPLHVRAMLEQSQRVHEEEVAAQEVNADGPDRPEQTDEGPVVATDDTEEQDIKPVDLEDVEDEFDAPDEGEEDGAFLRVRNYDDRYLHRPHVVMEPHRSPDPMEASMSDTQHDNNDDTATAGTAGSTPGALTPQASDDLRADHHHHGHHHHHHEDDEDDDDDGNDGVQGHGDPSQHHHHEDWDEYEEEEEGEYEDEEEYYDRYEDGHRPWWFEGHRPNNATLPSESILSTYYTLRQSYEGSGPVVKMYCPSRAIHYNESLECWYVITNTFSFALRDVTFQVSISDGNKVVKSPITIPSVAWDYGFIGGFDVPVLQPGQSWVIQVWVWCTAKRGRGSAVQRATLSAPDEQLANGDSSYGNLPSRIQVVGEIDIASGPGPVYPYERPNEWGINDPNWRPSDDGDYHRISYPRNPRNPPPLGTDPLAWSSSYATDDDDTSGTIGEGGAFPTSPPPDTSPSTPATPSTPTTPTESASAPTTPTTPASPSVPPAGLVPAAGAGTGQGGGAPSLPVDSASNLTNAIMPLIGHAVTAPTHVLTPPPASTNTTSTTNSTALPPAAAATSTAPVSPPPLSPPMSPSKATNRNATTSAAAAAAAADVSSGSSDGKRTRRARRRFTLAKRNRRDNR